MIQSDGHIPSSFRIELTFQSQLIGETNGSSASIQSTVKLNNETAWNVQICRCIAEFINLYWTWLMMSRREFQYRWLASDCWECSNVIFFCCFCGRWTVRGELHAQGRPLLSWHWAKNATSLAPMKHPSIVFCLNGLAASRSHCREKLVSIGFFQRLCAWQWLKMAEDILRILGQ